MLLMVIISGQGTMRSPRRLFPDRHQRIACICLLRIRASVIPSTYYYAVLIILYCCILLCWEDGKLHVESVNGRTVHVPLVAWRLKPCAIISDWPSYAQARFGL